MQQFLQSLNKQEYKVFCDLVATTQIYRKNVNCESLLDEVKAVMEYSLTKHKEML